jgi:hypothetical protein
MMITCVVACLVSAAVRAEPLEHTRSPVGGRGESAGPHDGDGSDHRPDGADAAGR